MREENKTILFENIDARNSRGKERHGYLKDGNVELLMIEELDKGRERKTLVIQKEDGELLSFTLTKPTDDECDREFGSVEMISEPGGFPIERGPKDLDPLPIPPKV